MLDLEVRPGRSLSGAGFEFILGMPIQQAIHLIRKCDRDIKGVQLWYSDAVPLHMDIVICLQNDGIKLYFDPGKQRLRMIEVFDLQRVKLCYCNNLFSAGEGAAPTLSQIQMVFGATHPAELDPKAQSFRLSFRGVQFEFTALGETGAPNTAVTQSRRARNADCPLNRFTIFATASSAGAAPQIAIDLVRPLPPPIPAECFLGLSFAEKVELIRAVSSPTEGLQNITSPLLNGSTDFIVPSTRSDGLRFTLLTDEPAPVRSASGPCADIPSALIDDHVLDGVDSLSSNDLTFTDYSSEEEQISSISIRRVVRTVYFGDTVQDVMTACGSPTRVFYKDEDKMKIHAGDGWRRVTSGRSDYFFNYAALGVDILFDSATHRVKKFVLHTNYPGHYDFGSYDRCLFAIPLYRYSTNNALNALRTDADTGAPVDGATGAQKLQRSVSGAHHADAKADVNGDRIGSAYVDTDKQGHSRSSAHDLGQATNENEKLEVNTVKTAGIGERRSLYDLGQSQSAARAESDVSGALKQTDLSADMLSGTPVSKFIVTPFTKWSQIVSFLGRPDLRPVELNRSSSQGAPSPFGATFCYGVQDLIFEVMSNDHIGSVTVYQRTSNNTAQY